VFFTLSGYLITDLLLGQQHVTGRLQLADFWRRRARRLLPALFVMLAVVSVWVAVADAAQLAALRGMVIASALYVGNWWLIIQHSSYFAQFGPQSPLGHLWSLAVEEQFYLVWPWLLLIGLHVTRGRRHRTRWLVGGTLLLAVVSALLMAMLYHPGYDPTRVYDGTDTRAFALLIGAALAFVWPSRQLGSYLPRAARRALTATGFAGLLVILLLIWRTGEYSAFMYRGGMVLLSLATAAVVFAAASPASVVGRVLGWRPLRWIGVRSYGIYLWHYPIILLTSPPSGQETFVRGSLQVLASIGVAAVSWKFIEEPIRHGAIGRWWTQLRAAPWRQRPANRHGWAMAGASGGVLVLAGCGLAGVVPAASAGPAIPGVPSVASASAAGGAGAAGAAAAGRAATASSGHGDSPVALPAGVTDSESARTSCRSVVHIGDSTSDGLVEADYLPDAAQRIPAQYRRVGVQVVHTSVIGGTSIWETLPGTVNALTVAKRYIRAGYQGCWVLALGTNDTADVYVGSTVSMAQRIRLMMSVIGDQPVMWVNVKTLLPSGPYAESHMRQWDQALLRACPEYPNMRVYNWAAAARRGWFIDDGIHYTSAGYAARSRLIAAALAQAFPQDNTSSTLVHARGPNGVGPAQDPSCLVG
jgi:peptidoglycan/LPS O-acetylase OafA/YrhL